MDNNPDAIPLSYTTPDQDTSGAPATLRNGMKADVAKMMEAAQTSWLTKYQVMYILEHWQALGLVLSTTTPQKPPSGTMFLYDRTTNRYFRKDGHNWRKKGQGYTVRETHEKIKIAEKGVLNCYYAHSEEATGIMRRSYWLLESEDNVVLVHYLEGMASRRMLTNSDGTAIARPQSRKRKNTASKDEKANKRANASPADIPTASDEGAKSSVPMGMQDIYDASLLMLNGGPYAGAGGSADIMQLAAAAGAFPAAGMHPQLLDSALLSHQFAQQNPAYFQSLGLGADLSAAQSMMMSGNMPFAALAHDAGQQGGVGEEEDDEQKVSQDGGLDGDKMGAYRMGHMPTPSGGMTQQQMQHALQQQAFMQSLYGAHLQSAAAGMMFPELMQPMQPAGAAGVPAAPGTEDERR